MNYSKLSGTDMLIIARHFSNILRILNIRTSKQETNFYRTFYGL